ncbi:SDR family NAD(P)-dependent oxidoreductase [Deinococcus ruber]|uniref:Short-chain dehydrogenase n=1 Tax=Deinococcus ruber TaxID=1848197 RepID=A0A918CFI6_9DEIO|nr:SDR family NAD(P)-dependent oxidoreductase [Deinococcus ruber]GGR19702.1 short-chain dehydrogenase [Deinococcus ruber]
MAQDKTTKTVVPSILIIGASRGLGLAMAAEFVKRGWQVMGTVRGEGRTPLHTLQDQFSGQVDIEHVDITDPAQLTALHDRLIGRSFDILFVNAGTANRHQNETIAQVSTDEFMRVMLTNALGPLRTVEALQDLVPEDGLIGVMSSGQGSVSNNERGGHEVYRGSKSALNQYMRSYAARHAGEDRALILTAPGWVNTALGGPAAPLTTDESIPALVDVLLAKRTRPGLEYLDYRGQTVPW